MAPTDPLNGQPRPADARARADDLMRSNVQTIAQLEAVEHQSKSRTDRIVDAIASFCGSLGFVYLNTLWIAVWILLNLLPDRKWCFDPFPFPFLTLLVALEAIFLSTFILISQNRQAQLAERRNHLGLQINLLSEQENTKMLHMLDRIEKRLGIEAGDPTIAALAQATEPEKLVEEIKRHVEEGSDEGMSESP